MITLPKHSKDSPAKLQDILIETSAGMLNAKESAYYHIKNLDYRDFPLQSSKFFIHTGKNVNNVIANSLNTVWVRWKDRIVILIESNELTIDDKVTVYLANISEEHETLTVSGTVGNNYVDVPGGVTTTVFLKKYLRITGSGDDTDSIYTIDYYTSNKLYLKEKLNNTISGLQAKIISKVPGSTYYWKDAAIYSDYDDLKDIQMGTANFGVFNLDAGPAASYPWPSAITKSGITLFYIILDNNSIYMEENKELFKNLSTENIEMESADVDPGVSLFDMYKSIESIDTYTNKNSLFFNEIDMDTDNWELYSFHHSSILSITAIASVYSGGSYKIVVTSSALISTVDDYYLYYKPYNMVYRGSKINGTTIDFTIILPYNIKGDLSTSAFFAPIVSGGNTFLISDYLRLQRNFILSPKSRIFIAQEELYLNTIQIYFSNGTFTESAYTLGTPEDLSGLDNGQYVIYVKIRNGTSNFQHTIESMGIETVTLFTTNRLSDYGDCIVTGLIDKYGVDLYALTVYGTFFPGYSKLKEYNALVEGTVAISNAISYNTATSQWEKTPTGTIPQGICEDAVNKVIIFKGEANIPGLTLNVWYYLDDTTPGLIVTSPNSGIQVGYAIAADRLLLDFKEITGSMISVKNGVFDTGARIPSSSAPSLDYDAVNNKWRTCTANTLPFGFLNGSIIVFSGITTNTSGFGLTPGQVYYQHAVDHGKLTPDNTGYQVGYCLEDNIFLVQIRKVL